MVCPAPAVGEVRSPQHGPAQCKQYQQGRSGQKRWGSGCSHGRMVASRRLIKRVTPSLAGLPPQLQAFWSQLGDRHWGRCLRRVPLLGANLQNDVEGNVVAYVMECAGWRLAGPALPRQIEQR
jgi:hypothetical protein